LKAVPYSVTCAVLGLTFSLSYSQTPAQSADDFFRAIRAGDSEGLSRLATISVDVKDRLDTTPLHYAALYGNLESVRILLDRGASVNARNKSDATPLIYAAYNFEKTRLLVAKGADVNVHSSRGMTPLKVAASVHGNIATLRYLLEKGADLKQIDESGADALQIAALKGDAAMVRLLLDKGADARTADKGGYTALLNAFTVVDPERVRMLLDAGADVNAANTNSGEVKNGPIDLVHLNAVFLAAPDQDPSVVKALLVRGAHADERDHRKLTPLSAAVSTDDPKLETIRQLIAAHADVNARDGNGESVLDWALKYRNPEVLTILKDAGAKPAMPFEAPKPPANFAVTAKDAVAKSTALLVKSGQTFFAEGGGCVGCHHQPIDARVFAALREAHQNPDAKLRQIFLDGMTARRPGQLSGLPQMTASGGDYDELLAQGLAMVELGEPASPATDAVVHYLAARQELSGAWYQAGGPRPPLESSSVTRTAYAVRILATYGWPARRAELKAQIARARTFLATSKPVNSFEQADRIMGLKAAGVPDTDLAASAAALIKLQRADGGWAQTPYLDSDAFATGTVLATLYRCGLIKSSDPAYVKGVAFLLKTQFPDGSWYVRGRTPKLQPYFQSAFPYDHDQWISYTATGMAVMALAPALQ